MNTKEIKKVSGNETKSLEIENIDITNNNTQSLYNNFNEISELFYFTVKETFKRIDVESDAEFWTKDQNNNRKNVLKQWSKIFNIVINKYYYEITREIIKSLNLKEVKETTIIGIYKTNYLKALDINIFNSKELRDKEIYDGLMSINNEFGCVKEMQFKFNNAKTLTIKQIDELWAIFEKAFLGMASKSVIDIYKDTNFYFKEYAYLAINDGYIEINKDGFRFLPFKNFKPEILTIFKIPINSSQIEKWTQLNILKNNNKYSIFKEFIINKIDDVDCLATVVADLFQPLITSHILPFLIGDGGAGKSTLQNVLSFQFNNNFIDSFSLNSALNNPFEAEPLFNKFILFTSELGSSSIKEQSKLNNIVSREKMSLNGKYKDVKTARPIAKLLIAGNEVIKTLDNDGLNRRLVFMKFNNNKPIRSDLNGMEFENEMKNDIVGLTAFIIYGTQLLLNKGWNYETFLSLSSQELQQEFEGQYSPISELLNNAIKNNVFTYDANGIIANSTLIDLLMIFNQTSLDTNYENQEFVDIIQGANINKNNRKKFMSELKRIGFHRLEKRLNKYYPNKEIPIKVFAVKNERNFSSNIGHRYQQSVIIKNLKLNLDNEEFVEFLKSSEIRADYLEQYIGNIRNVLAPKIEYGDSPMEYDLKEIWIPLYSLFSIYAPRCAMLNRDRVLNKTEIDEYDEIWDIQKAQKGYKTIEKGD